MILVSIFARLNQALLFRGRIMFAHRFRDHVVEPVSTVVAAPAPAFVPCPVFVAAHPAQLSFVAEVYRVAREMTEAQLRRPARSWPPVFSKN